MSQYSWGITVALQELLVEFLQFMPALIAAMVVFVIGLVLAIIISRSVRIALERRDVKPEAVTVLVRLTYIVLLTFTLVISLQQIGFNLTAFLAGLGILGFTIGFALQDVSKNFVAGLLLLVQQPFSLGDTIEVDDYIGEVLEINIRATRIRDLDGRIVLIPNADVFSMAIINYTQAEFRRVEIQLGVASDSDLEEVRQTALAAIADIRGLVEEPAPKVVFHTFGDYAINVALYFWIDTKATGVADAKDAAIKAINTAFIAHKIEMPSPIQTVVVQSN